MCGIVGYVGREQAAPILLDGLRRLEYRGYDSAGVAIVNGKGVETRKCAGRIASLTKLMSEKPPTGSYGISHTRWATHGKVTDGNAHPHFDQSGKLALVHNGVIENYAALKEQLEIEGGHTFQSETDTEVLCNLIAYHYTKEPTVKGQTASSSYKPAILSNGLRTNVPPHIGVGTRIVVMTEDGSYVERAKD